MKFHEIHSDKINLIRAYDEQSVTVHEKKITSSAILFPDNIIDNLHYKSIDDLFSSNLGEVFKYEPEIVLIGMHDNKHNLTQEQIALFNKRNVSVELMSLPAGCRTFNILISEQRKAVLIILLSL